MNMGRTARNLRVVLFPEHRAARSVKEGIRPSHQILTWNDR